MGAERRLRRRYSVQGDGIEVFSRETKVIGKLKNISRDGLAFCYPAVESEEPQVDTIDIMATGSARFFLSGLVCRKVYDIGILAEDQSFTGTDTRLCGMEFIRVESEKSLEFFLKNYLDLPAEEIS